MMKRYTHLAQFFLGVTFNWGVILAWSEGSGLDTDWLKVVPLFIGSIMWTVLYDTVYALQDIKYDKKLNLKSFAMVLGKSPTSKLQIFNLMSVGFYTAFGYSSNHSLPYYLSIMTKGLSNFWMLSRLNPKNIVQCGQFFATNGLLGALLVWGTLTSRLSDPLITQN
ncbi:MAG: Para-hydroxybenzoate--polyprenyltransferase, mitochondrial precursor (PHB:polyprenyltransferase) [Paramarteilia canceri]